MFNDTKDRLFALAYDPARSNDRHCIVEHLGWYRSYYFYNRWYVLGLEDYTWSCYTDEEFKEEFELVEGR